MVGAKIAMFLMLLGLGGMNFLRSLTSTILVSIFGAITLKTSGDTLESSAFHFQIAFAIAARVLGLRDRGTLEVGAYADVNVFDAERIQTAYPEYSFDFPNGKGRLKVRSTGYAVTIVNGEVVTEQGEHTGNRPGRIIREFARG